MATYEVTGAAAVVTDRAGKVRYYYTGAAVPGDVSAEQLKRLTERGLIRKVADPTPSDAELKEVLAKGEVSETGAGFVERPSQVATRALWVDYAVSRGLDRSAVEAMKTKQEIIDACSAE
jgi:hypothetical protein